MEFKVINICVLAVFFLILNTEALPRDSSGVKVEPVAQVHDNSDVKDTKMQKVDTDNFNTDMTKDEVHIPGRVSCEYSEPTEDPVCQEHCFPKGYKYGLCTSGVCSCI